MHSQNCLGQEIRIKYGKTNIALNEVFQISIEVENAKIEKPSSFPKIKNLKKKGIERGTRTNIIAGETSSIEVFTQKYYPEKEGKINVPSFFMYINGRKINVEGTTIKVGPYDESKRTKHDEIREQLLFNSQEEQKILEEQADAFLGLSTDKDEVFVEEGFTVTLALYIAQTNQAELQLKDDLTIANQIAKIAKKLKPATCWEENFNIDNLEENIVNIADKNYYQYKIYQATFFPINAEKIVFPTVGLEILKYVKNKKTGKKQAEEETFYTNVKTITVKPLPEHPAKDKIVSGNFNIITKVPQQVLITGESFKASISILGEGNISAIQAPIILENPEFEFYTPDIKEYISRADNIIKGVKTFTYQLIPKEAGEYNLNNYFTWIYFNPVSEKYDTLVPQATLKISGESLVDAEISSAHFSDFYKNINQNDNNLHQNTFEIYLRWWFRGFAILAFTFSLFIILFYKKVKSKS